MNSVNVTLLLDYVEYKSILCDMSNSKRER